LPISARYRDTFVILSLFLCDLSYIRFTVPAVPGSESETICLFGEPGPGGNMARLRNVFLKMYITFTWEVLEMIKATTTIFSTMIVTGLLASGLYAAPITLNSAQMDGVAAGGVDKVSGFVCPVITQSAVGMHNPKALPLGESGTYTVGPPTGANGGALMIPVHATNADGYGIPGVTSGPNQQSQPGDTNYTAIWKN